MRCANPPRSRVPFSRVLPSLPHQPRSARSKARGTAPHLKRARSSSPPPAPARSATPLVPVAPATLHAAPVALMLPSSAAWFALDAVHEREVAALPHETALPQYRTWRDFMVHAYWQQPSRYLSATACRRALSGDAAALLRVHAFLEAQGIINYHVTAAAVPPALPAAVAAAALPPPPPLSAAPVPLLATRRDAQALPGGLRYVCAQCGAACGALRYENLRDDAKAVWECEVTLCEGCYSTGKMPAGWRATQFVARETGTALDPLHAGVWTPDATLALLAALEQYGEDWSQVARHVGGGVTPQQCLLHFVRLPIQDQFVGPLLEPPLATPASSNPALQLVTLLAASAPPSVAGAAAQAAVNAPSTARTQAALEAAGARAAMLAERESQRLAGLVGQALQVQLKGLAARMARFGELEAHVEEKKAQLRRDLLKLYATHADMAAAANQGK